MKKPYLILAILAFVLVAIHCVGGGEIVPALFRGDPGLKTIPNPKFDMPLVAGGAFLLTSILFWVINMALHLAFLALVIWLVVRYFRNRTDSKQSPFDAAVSTLKDLMAHAQARRETLVSDVKAIDQHFHELGSQLGEISNVPKSY